MMNFHVGDKIFLMKDGLIPNKKKAYLITNLIEGNDIKEFADRREHSRYWIAILHGYSGDYFLYSIDEVERTNEKKEVTKTCCYAVHA
jgi:hypothetical protein